MNVDAVLAEADKISDKGSPEWLGRLFVAFSNECGPDGITPEELDKLVQRLVALYCRRATVQQFARLVQSMRNAQKQYFATRAPAWLERSRADENAVDKWVAAALNPPERQRPLFDTSNDRTRPNYE